MKPSALSPVKRAKPSGRAAELRGPREAIVPSRQPEWPERQDGLSPDMHVARILTSRGDYAESHSGIPPQTVFDAPAARPWVVMAAGGRGSACGGDCGEFRRARPRARWHIELIRCRAGESADFELEACDAQGRLAVRSDLAHRNGSGGKWAPPPSPHERQAGPLPPLPSPLPFDNKPRAPPGAPHPY
jgi:hypothetical protein